MARDLTAGMQTALAGATVRPVLIGYLAIDTDPVLAWTGPGIFAPSGTLDTVLNGLTFQPIAPIVRMSTVLEDQSIGGAVTLTLAGHDLDEDLLRQVVRDQRAWRGKPAYLWLGLLTSDEASVVADPVRIKTGVIINIAILRGKEEAYAEVTIDRDLGNARAAPYRWIDHPRLYATDTWSTYIKKLANKPKGLTASDVNTQTITNYNEGDWTYYGPCWVAREVYGVKTGEWLVFRNWLFTTAPKGLLTLYVRYGEQLALWLRDKPKMKKFFKYWMDKAVYA